MKMCIYLFIWSTVGYSVNVDENVELVIALEMSRLQMIEDTMKMKLKERDFP